MTRLMRLSVFVVGLVGWVALPVAAQTHPCDTIPGPTTVTVGAPFAIGTCHNLKGEDGTTPVTITSWKVSIDGQPFAPIAMTRGSSANAQGLWYFESAPTLTVATAGAHSFTVLAVNAVGDGKPAIPFSFTADPAPQVPGAPVRPRVIR